MYEQSPKRDFKLATLWQERGQLDRAIATYRQLFAFPKLGERARHELEAIYDAQQDWETALDIRLLDLRDRVSQRPDGEKSPAELERERVVGAAIEAARRRVRSTGPKRFASPQSIDWPADPLALALSLLTIGERDAAFNALLVAIAREPDRGWDKRGHPFFRICRDRRDDPDFAWGDRLCDRFARLLDREPDSDVRQLNYAEISWCVGRFGRAQQLYGQAARQQLAQRRPEILTTSEPIIAIEPSFAIVGAMKSGSTSLYAYLQQHPQVLPLARKEVDYWSWRYHRGARWFRSHFPEVPASWKAIAGDASPTYLQHALAPQRMLEAAPNFKAIAVLRNPVDRTISHHHHNNRRASDLRSLEVAIDRQIAAVAAGENDPQRLDNAVASSLYAPHVTRWRSQFGRDRFLVILSDDLFADPHGVLRRVFEFLGIADREIPDVAPRHVAQYDRGDAPVRDRLREFFQPSIRELEALCGLETPWL